MSGSGQEISKVVLSPEGRICDLSERMLAHFGGGLKTQFLDRNLFDVLAELSYSELADKLYLAVKSARAGQVTTFEAGLQPPGRAALELVCSVRPRFAGDELVFYEVGLLEISEDEGAAEYNQERERHFEALFDAISMAMLIVREESIIRANPAALDLLGIDNLQTLKGRNLQRIFPDLPPQTPAETQLRRADGSLLKVELTITPWMLSGRRHSVLVCYDLGSQEQMREVLRAATQSAEQASLAKSRLLTTMSHELRTPLNGILGLLHLAQNSPDPAKKADYLNRLERTTRGLLTIVNDVLDFSSVEKGEAELNEADFELEELKSSLVQSLAEWTRDRPELTVTISFARELPARLRGDQAKLLKILQAICHNAVKFTSQGKIEFRAELLGQEATASLAFSVADTGIGMTAEQLVNAFNPFSQADSSASRYYGGIGLSLALCKRYAEVLGGTLSAESRLGKGSRFWLTLPLLIPADSQIAAAPPGRAAADSALWGRALVVDDNDTNQEVAAEMLRQLGMQVEVAANGWQALEQCKRHHFEVILMDLQMPGMDGLEATRRLRAGGCEAPIVALTANTRPEDQEACRRAGMDGFLSKPVDPEVLIECLNPLLKSGRLQFSPPAASVPCEITPIPGVDLDKALHRLGGNGRLLRTLLVQFGRRHQDHARKIQEATRNANLQQVRELSHALKGSAANLGVENLSHLSMQIEHLAREGSLPGHTLLAALEIELERLVPQMLALEEQVEGSDCPVDRERARELLNRLQEQLDRDLTEAFQVQDHLEEVLKETGLASKGAKLRNSLEEFDMDRAREFIQELLIQVT